LVRIDFTRSVNSSTVGASNFSPASRRSIILLIEQVFKRRNTHLIN
jgi:hypothetical protein